MIYIPANCYKILVYTNNTNANGSSVFNIDHSANFQQIGKTKNAKAKPNMV